MSMMKTTLEIEWPDDFPKYFLDMILRNVRSDLTKIAEVYGIKWSLKEDDENDNSNS